MSGAALNRGKSNQDVGTPKEFIAAVEKRFGHIWIDLAANEQNRVAPEFFGPGSPLAQDAFDVQWNELNDTVWCNPPFNATAKFIEKAVRELRDRAGFSLFLTPSSPGANWYKLLEENAFVIQLEDRMAFAGQPTKYPKDLTLSVFGFGLVGRARWHWDDRVVKSYQRVPKVKTPKRARKPRADADALLVAP